MNLALNQAEKILGNTKKNPAVGCVIVKKKCVLAAGYTGFGGRPHAEKNAIQFDKKKIKNSHLYVTLEPCSHYGKTPPCINKIAKNKIKKVFFSIHDVDKRSFKKCKKKLKKKNILVNSGLLSGKINEFYKSYTNHKKNKLPYVAAKIAVSKDFFTVNKRKKYITNDFSRARVHLLRSKHDCVVTSVKTIIKDDSKLTCRIDGLENRSPARIILDKKLKIPVNSYVIKSASSYPTYIFFNKGNKKKINKLIKLKVKLTKIPLDNNHDFNLKEVLERISKKGFSRVFLEAGLSLTNNFLSEKLVDKLILFISSKNIGKNGSNNFKNTMNSFLKNKKPISYNVNLFYDRLFSYKIK